MFENSLKCRSWIFIYELLSTQNVNIDRFARNVECDCLGDFQTLCGGIIQKIAMQGHQGEEKATSTECYYTALHQKFTSKGRRRPDNTHDPNQSDCGGGSQHKEIG